MNLFPAEPHAHAEVGEIQTLELAVVRHDGVTLDALPGLFDTGYAAVARLFAEGTLTPTGPALAIYYGDPMGVFDLELGFPVTQSPSDPIAVDGAVVVGSTLPAATAVVSSHVGPYDGLGSAWGTLVADAATLGHEPSGIWVEAYISDPVGADPESLRTDLILPTRV
jgi:effector-binding domain-containing protein